MYLSITTLLLIHRQLSAKDKQYLAWFVFATYVRMGGGETKVTGCRCGYEADSAAGQRSLTAKFTNTWASTLTALPFSKYGRYVHRVKNVIATFRQLTESFLVFHRRSRSAL